jgi:hypothetical protein
MSVHTVYQYINGYNLRCEAASLSGNIRIVNLLRLLGMQASLDDVRQQHPSRWGQSIPGIPGAMAHLVCQKLQGDVPQAWQVLSEALR